MKKLFFTFYSVLTLISCSKTEETLVPDNFTPITIVPEVIKKGNFLGGDVIFPQQNTIISDTAGWNSIIVTLNNYQNKIEDINVNSSPNFNDYTYIAFFDSVKYDGIHAIGTSNITENATNIVITISYTVTTPNVQSVTQPYHVIKIPKSTKPIIFQ